MAQVDDYIVLRNSDVDRLKSKDKAKLKSLISKLDGICHLDGVEELACTVIESTEPEFDTVNHMRESRLQMQRYK